MQKIEQMTHEELLEKIEHYFCYKKELEMVSLNAPCESSKEYAKKQLLVLDTMEASVEDWIKDIQ